MAEFELSAFTTSLQEMFLNNPNMPKSTLYYMDYKGRLQLNSEKHPNRTPLHLQEAIADSFRDSKVVQQDMITFDIGNEKMENMHPYYHILENTPYIRIANQGSKKTKGSQASVEKIGERDYEIVSWNGKTFTKEYRRNVRGMRNRDEKVTRRYGQVLVRRDSNSYKNDHYQYIERILDSITPLLADIYGLRLARKIDNGLAEEYFSQFNEAPANILDILGSFE